MRPSRKNEILRHKRTSTYTHFAHHGFHVGVVDAGSCPTLDDVGDTRARQSASTSLVSEGGHGGWRPCRGWSVALLYCRSASRRLDSARECLPPGDDHALTSNGTGGDHGHGEDAQFPPSPGDDLRSTGIRHRHPRQVVRK